MRHAVVTFGRFNPPTLGHQKLVEYLKTFARIEHADLYVFLSSSQDATRNPLTFDERHRMVRQAFDVTVGPAAKSFADVFEALRRKDYTHITCFVGSDRAHDLDRLKHYFEQQVPIQRVDIKEVPRLPGDVSATMVRQAAIAGHKQLFLSLLPSSLSRPGGEYAYHTIRERLGVTEMADPLRSFSDLLTEEDPDPGKVDKAKKDPKREKKEKEDPDGDGDTFTKDKGESDEKFNPEDNEVDSLGRKAPDHLTDPGPPPPAEFAQAKIIINPPMHASREKLQDIVDAEASPEDKPITNDEEDKEKGLNGDAGAEDADPDKDSDDDEDSDKDDDTKDGKDVTVANKSKKKVKVSFHEILNLDNR